MKGVYSRIERGIQSRYSYRRVVVAATTFFVGAVWVVFIAAIILSCQQAGKADRLDRIERSREGHRLLAAGVESERRALALALAGDAADAAAPSTRRRGPGRPEARPPGGGAAAGSCWRAWRRPT